MAASGIAEHHEARRREGVYLRKAFYQVEQGERLPHPPPGEERAPSSYDEQVYSQSRKGARRDGHDPTTVDRQRRTQHFNQTQSEYSAKIGNRYSSIDYISQW